MFDSRLIFPALLFLTAFAVHTAPAEPDFLSKNECKELFRHQLDVYSSDGLLSAVVKKEKSRMGIHESEQIDDCALKFSRSNYECQMKASTVIGIHECNRLHGAPADDKKNEPSRETKHTNSLTKTPSSTVREEDSPVPVRVSAGDCRKAYEKLLFTFKDSPYLENGERERLVSFWSSQNARIAFENKCVNIYSPGDIECILNSKNRAMIQSCMLKVPDF